MVMAWGLGLEHKKLLHAFAACQGHGLIMAIYGMMVRREIPEYQPLAWRITTSGVYDELHRCSTPSPSCRTELVQTLRDLGCASKLRFYGHPSNFRGCWWWALQCGFSRQIYRAKMAKLLSKAGSAGWNCLKSDVYSAAFGSVLYFSWFSPIRLLQSWADFS